MEFWIDLRLVKVYLLFIITSSVLSLDPQQSLHRHEKRNSDNNEVFLDSLEESFQSNLRITLDDLNMQHRPLLIHTQGNELLFLREDNSNATLPILSTSYENLKATSHLPVTAVSLLIPDLLANNGSLTDSQLPVETRQRLSAFRDLVRNTIPKINNSNVFLTPNQLMRQIDINERVLDLLSSVLNQSSFITMETLTHFSQAVSSALKANAVDVVKDYLICLNNSVSMLIKSEDVSIQDLVVIVSLEPFARKGSFLVQYYMQLLNVSSESERLILSPPQTSQSYSNCTESPKSASSHSISVFSNSTFLQSISNIFNNDSFSSIHKLMSLAAENVICSEDFFLPSCVNESLITDTADHIVGFETKIEKGYIVLMIFFGGLAVMFGIVLVCIAYEDRLMTSEIKSQGMKGRLRLEGPTVFTPVTSFEETNVSEQQSLDTFTGSDSQTLGLLSTSSDA